MNEIYKQKREPQKMINKIIETAEVFFCTKGYENTSMDDIAEASKYTKRTIYKHFANKEDVFFAVSWRGYLELIKMIEKSTSNQTTGFEKIRSAYYSYYEFYKKHPQLLQLINMSGIIKSVASETPYFRKFTEADKQLFEILLMLFIGGRNDGSIRSDIEISMLAFSSVFTAVGFFQIFALSGDTYTQNFNMDTDVFAKLSIELMLDTLRNR